MNPNATSFHPASARDRGTSTRPGAADGEREQAHDGMVIVFDDGSSGSEEDLPSPSRGSPARGLVHLDELRNIHQHNGQAEDASEPQAWWAQADRHLDLVHSVKDFWRVFSDDGEAQGVMLAYNYMYPHVDQHADPRPIANAVRGVGTPQEDEDEETARVITCHTTTTASGGEEQMMVDQHVKEESDDALRTQQLHEVLRDVRRFIQTRMHPVQETYLGTTGDGGGAMGLFDNAGSGFNLQATLGPARTRRPLRLSSVPYGRGRGRQRPTHLVHRAPRPSTADDVLELSATTRVAETLEPA